jgi:SAM-dependent methyltransferase
MHVNYLYQLEWAQSVVKSNPTARILDFGCGSGNVVIAGRERGLDIYGADVFYAGATSKNDVEKSGLWGVEIREISMTRAKLDFDDEYFDFVMSNQVFEHLENMDVGLSEIYRVMKKDALFLCLFPSSDVVREGHIGIPFAHWFSKGSRVRYYYILFFRAVGLGYFKGDKSIVQWTREKLDWLDRYTYYRDKDEIFRSFSRYFGISMIEDDYIKFRLLSTGKVSARFIDHIFMLPLMPLMARVLFRRLAGMVILAKKR